LSGRKKVLVTGGGGFIGSHLLASPLAAQFELLSPGHRELDLCDTEAVDAYFKAQRPAAVVHAAGKPGHRNAPDHTNLLRDNLRMFHNLARHAGELERLVHLGSGAVYGLSHAQPRMAEAHYGAHVPDDEHGFTQYLCEQRAAQSANIVSLRLFGVFGPREDYAIRFISNLMAKAVHGLPLTMKQDRRFDYLWVADLAPVVGWCLEGAPRHQAYNVTPDETVSLRRLAERILALSGQDLPIVAAEPGQGPEYSGDNARLRAECPGFSPTPLGRSLPGLYQWTLEHKDHIQREALLHDK
jgi:GDP-L-fucose synthase